MEANRLSVQPTEIAECLRWASEVDCQVIRRLAFERDKLRQRLSALGSYVATAESENTQDWMTGLVEHLNEAAKLVDPSAVFVWHKSNADGAMWITKRDIP